MTLGDVQDIDSSGARLKGIAMVQMREDSGVSIGGRSDEGSEKQSGPPL